MIEVASEQEHLEGGGGKEGTTRSSYEDRWIDLLCAGSDEPGRKRAAILGLPLLKLALYGKKVAFERVNGNKGRSRSPQLIRN